MCWRRTARVRADMVLNLSAVSSRSVAGKFLRWPLRFVPRELAVPIPQGTLRGKRWIVGSATHGCWLGSYEYTKQRLFERRVAAGCNVLAGGANRGVFYRPPPRAGGAARPRGWGRP